MSFHIFAHVSLEQIFRKVVKSKGKYTILKYIANFLP